MIFRAQQKPSVVFSGLVYPDFDFLGRQLQNLGDHSTSLDLLTFSFAPMVNGWGIVFAWHSHCSETCVPLMESLATRMYEDGKPEDHLFRFVVSSCENLAMSPQWWEALPAQHKVALEKAASYEGDVFAHLRPDYLVRDLEGITAWKFDEVIANME